MSFSYKISGGSRVTSHQSSKLLCIYLTNINFFIFSKIARNSRTTGNFVVKTHREASYINAGNRGKNCVFNTTFG